MKVIDQASVIFHLFLMVQGVYINPGLPIDDEVMLGDVQLAFFSELYKSMANKECRAELYGRSVQDGQAAKWAVQEVNNNPNLLPNITLGIILLNDCGKNSVVLARATQILPRRTCYRSTICEDNWQFPVQPPWPPQIGLPAYDNVIGVIGPPTSSRSVLTASLFAAYELPEISYTATSDVLSDKATYPFFSRIVPPDNFQAQAMVSLLVHFNWTYISTLNIADDYGRDGINNVITNARKHGICIAYSGEFHNEAEDSIYDDLVENLAKHPKARVVVIFMFEYNIRRLHLALERKDYISKFIFVATDAFLFSAYVGIEHLFLGTFATLPKYSKISKYSTYYDSLPVIRDPSRSYWEGQYTESDLACTWEDVIGRNIVKCSNFNRSSDIEGFAWSELSAGVIDSVLTFANALNTMINNKCPLALKDKDILYKCINGKDYLQYIRNTSFEGMAQHIQFDENGDLLGGYDIVYFGEREDGTLGILVIGNWNRLSGFEIDETKIRWDFKYSEANQSMPESVCAKPCKVGEYYIQGEKVCCWQCRRCRDYERISNKQRGCETCPELMWPNQEDFTMCVQITPTFMIWTDNLAIGLEAMGALGMVGTIVISLIFITYKERKVIRGSSRELMVPITFGMLVAFLTVFAHITKPTDWACYTNYFGFHLSCTFIFGPLFLKTARMYRIFSAAQRYETGITMVGANSQIGFTALITIVQVGICLAVSMVENPGAMLQMPVKSVKYVELLCNLPRQSLWIPLSFNVLLLLLCAILGFLTRKLPDNYNESWYIFISVATTIFIWMAFLPTYIMAFYAYHKAALLSFVLILNSCVTAMCLHLPKIYALFFVEESKIKVTNFDTSTFDSGDSAAVSTVA